MIDARFIEAKRRAAKFLPDLKRTANLELGMPQVAIVDGGQVIAAAVGITRRQVAQERRNQKILTFQGILFR